jgi:hypothetical protein
LYVPLEVPPSLPSPGLVVEPPQAPMAPRDVTKIPAKMRVETLMLMSSPPKTACDRRPAPPDSATVPPRGTDQAKGWPLPLWRPFFRPSVEPELVGGVGGADTRIQSPADQVVRVADLAWPAVHHAQAAYTAVTRGVTVEIPGAWKGGGALGALPDVRVAHEFRLARSPSAAATLRVDALDADALRAAVRFIGGRAVPVGQADRNTVMGRAARERGILAISREFALDAALGKWIAVPFRLPALRVTDASDALPRPRVAVKAIQNAVGTPPVRLVSGRLAIRVRVRRYVRRRVS